MKTIQPQYPNEKLPFHDIVEVARPGATQNLLGSSWPVVLTRKFFLITIFFVSAITTIQAQQSNNYALHANIIYHFTKYIDWPGNKKSGDFIIGVTGDTPIYNELKKNVANKMVGNQKIVVKQFSASSDAFNCHILFISEDESSKLKKIAANTAGTPMLVVSESKGLAGKGSCINFVIVNERLKLEINTTNIEQRNLSIASELLQLGKILR